MKNSIKHLTNEVDYTSDHAFNQAGNFHRHPKTVPLQIAADSEHSPHEARTLTPAAEEGLSTTVNFNTIAARYLAVRLDLGHFLYEDHLVLCIKAKTPSLSEEWLREITQERIYLLNRLEDIESKMLQKVPALIFCFICFSCLIFYSILAGVFLNMYFYFGYSILVTSMAVVVGTGFQRGRRYMRAVDATRLGPEKIRQLAASLY